MRAAELADEMVRRGMVAADAPPLPFGAAGRPWYVSAVLGTAGWLASLFAFVFVVMLFEPDTTVDFLVGGVVMLGAGFGLYVADRDSAFFEQLALALSLAGQLALIWAVGRGTESATATAAFATVLCAGLVVSLPNHFAKMLNAFFACIAWAVTIRLALWGEGSLGDTGLAVPLGRALIGWIVIWVPVAVGLHVLIAREAEWMATDARRAARPALTGLLLGLSVGTWTSEPLASLTAWINPSEVATNWLVLWPLLGVAAALFAAVSAFRLRHRAMVGVAIAGALLHLIQFYYMLGVTLVVKSYIMLTVGVVLLLLARGLRLGGLAPDAASPSAPSSAPVGSDGP